MPDLRVAVHLTLNGNPVPGFEQTLHQRRLTQEVQVFSVNLPAEQTAPTDLPVSGITTPEVIALRCNKDIIVFTGDADENPITLKAGGFILLFGIQSGKAEGLRVQNAGTEEAEHKGLVAGS